MIAALILEFGILWLLGEFIREYAKTNWLQKFILVWALQVVATVTYFAWKYLP